MFGNSLNVLGRRIRPRLASPFPHSDPGLEFDEVFTYDDGEIDVWRWVMTAGQGGRYVAAESKAGAGITGHQEGGDYVLSFHRPLGAASGWLKPRFNTRFTLMAPDTALKTSKVSLLGVRVGVMTATHRRIPA